MKLIQDSPEILITPDSKFAKEYIDNFIKTKGTFQLNDAIKESISSSGYSEEGQSFNFNGVYPHIFQNYEAVKLFKISIEALITKTNNKSGDFRVKNIDNVLFIMYFFVAYQGDVYASNLHNKYLDELIDVFISLLDRKLTPTDKEYIWVDNSSIGNERQVLRSEFNEEELKMNSGYKSISRMIGSTNSVFHFPSDGPIIIDKRQGDEKSISLPKKLSEQINNVIVDHIIKEHKDANSEFYKDLCGEELNTWEQSIRRKKAWYPRNNKVLYLLIKQLEKYFQSASKVKLVKKDIYVFIYDLFCLLRLIQQKERLNDTEKYSVIKTIYRDNS